MKVEIAPIPMGCLLDIMIDSFCNVLLCSVLKLMLGVDCYPFKGFHCAQSICNLDVKSLYYSDCNALHLEMSC